jgi:threonine/homoserine/homoserine lactone efflux protein
MFLYRQWQNRVMTNMPITALGHFAFGVSLERWLSFTLTEIAMALSPGPAVALVLACGLARGVRTSLFATLGILSANALYFLLSALGVGAVLLAMPDLFSVLRWLGAGYLAWLGANALLGRPSPISIKALQNDTRSNQAIFFTGLTLQLANPKSLLTFIAILPPFVNTSAPIAPQMIFFAISSIVPEFLILLGYGWLGSRAQHLAEQPGYALWTERFAGSLLLLIAGAVLFASRS